MKGTCDRCLKEDCELIGTPEFKICHDCHIELENDESITEEA